jgi:predicted Zn-dependent peptidase
MESQRLLHPVFREFYKDRDAMMEENRVNVEGSAQAKLLQNLLATAFAAHPYRNPELGWPSDLSTLRASQARAFFDKYYVPGNMTMTIVGDVNPADARRLAERYFGPLAARPLPAPPHTVEPPQAGPKSVEVTASTQPILITAYKRPDMYDKDDPVFETIRLVLSGGRTGMLYKQLVEEKHVAQGVQMVTPFPRGGRYPSLAVFLTIPASGRSVADNDKALNELLAGLQTRKVDEVALARAKTQARAAVIRQLANNPGLAEALSLHQVQYGNWRKLFTSLEDLNKVTPDDVQRVARQYFVINGRTLAISGRPGPAPVGDNR